MAVHTQEQMAWIVQQLASYVTPETVVAEFRRLWKDTACELTDVAACDRRRLAPDWQAYFDAMREAFLDAPTADKRVRIAELHRMYVKLRDANSIDLAAKLLMQIATEKGEIAKPGATGGGGSGAPGSDGKSPITAIELIVVDPKPIPEDGDE